MCIRDSFNGTVNVKTLESTPDNSDEVYQYSFPVSVKLAETEKKEIYSPVSYTHLDVYKRQGSARPRTA